MNQTPAQHMMDFIWASPSPYHCVETVAQRLESSGFRAIDETGAPVAIQPGQGAYIKRGGSIIAWRAGKQNPTEAGFRILGAHTDSPNLRVKPHPDAHQEGYSRVGVEVYGGVLLATWPDRDLGLSGRVVVEGSDGLETRLFRTDAPIARVPNLAIHLNRGVNKDGLKLDQQKHLSPMWGLGDQPFVDWLQDQMQLQDIRGWDLMFHDITPPAFGGRAGEFIFSARLDNQASCFQAIEALLAREPGDATQVVALFDHEEVGSRSHSGAMGQFATHVLERLVRDHDVPGSGGLPRAAANSFQVSIDMAHALHPNYKDIHEPEHRPVLGGGPVIKTHTEQRYATDALTMARFRQACIDVDVPVQDFVIRTDLPCGSTIGPISSAGLGIATVDVGNPMLSMHSIREQAGTADVAAMVKVLTHLLA